VCFPERVHEPRVRWAAVAALLLLTACSNGSAASDTGTPISRPSSTGEITIVSPTDGEAIHGSDVPVTVRLRGAKVVPATTTNVVPDQGHLHLTLDGEVVTMNFGLSDTMTDVAPGLHTLQVEFVATDHLPFDPRVIQQVTFTVKG
jgi:Domain of unknown function (DUF4399)